MIFAKIAPLIFSLVLIGFAYAQNIRLLLENMGRIVFWTLCIQSLWMFTDIYQILDTNYLLFDDQIGIFKAYLISSMGFFLIMKLTKQGFNRETGVEQLQAICCVGLSILIDNALYSYLIGISYCLIFLDSYKPNSLWNNLIYCSFFVGAFVFLSAESILISYFPSAVFSFAGFFLFCFFGGRLAIRAKNYSELVLFHMCSYAFLFLSFLHRHSAPIAELVGNSFSNLMLFQVFGFVLSIILLKAIVEEKYFLHLIFYWLNISLLGVFQYNLLSKATNSILWDSWAYIFSVGLLMFSLVCSSVLKEKKTELSEFRCNLSMRSFFSKYSMALGIFLTSSFVFPKSFQFYIFQINHIFMGDIQTGNILKLLSSLLPVLSFCVQFVGLLFLLSKTLPENSLSQSTIRPKLASKEGISFGILIILGLYFSSLYN